MALFGSRRKQSATQFTPQRKHYGNKVRNLGTQLTFETLEPRTLLAADLTLAVDPVDFAEIVGVVRSNPQGDADSANDSIVTDATVRLFRDGGDGSFDGGSSDDVQIGAAVTTDAQGNYHFQELGAGRYFVQVSPTGPLQFRSGLDVHEVNITPGEAQGVMGSTIDGFITDQIVEARSPLPASQPSNLSDTAVLGGERDLFVQLTESTSPIAAVSLMSNGGLLHLASNSGATGIAKIVWDGPDASGQEVNPTGLGGVDLTQSGGNTMTGIALTSGADHPNSQITLRVYRDADNWSEYTTLVPETTGGLASEQAIFRFNDSPTSQAGQGADFTQVGALELTFAGVPAADGQVSLVGLVGRATKRVNFTAEPRLSLGDHVWNDINNNGLHESAEPGIAGVKLNLYEDTDNNNQYSQGVDQWLGMTTTDAQGDYLFENLFPGKYTVQVDPESFLPIGPLLGLRSSLGNQDATDPDDNQNQDDNGHPLSSEGVWSSAVTLLGGTEPTNDGDTDANTNRTIDFGFFGFDLVLNKSIEQTSVAPNETLTYRVLVTNDGPSTAMNVQFTDTLPTGVTYQSSSINLDGIDLQHHQGKVTGDFGSMARGASIVVTIHASVNSDATGTLVNTATVAAPNEWNLTNNTDQVSNPVTPRIDLAVEKADSDDPVKPGDTFQYTLDIVNNGPSQATGVIVTDTLPTTGIRFQQASPVPTSISDNRLVFALGDLASGETSQVNITVQVEDDFVGQLENLVEVQGNETETNLNNNEDSETTQVNVEPASLGGNVFVDQNNDGNLDNDEPRLAGVLITLQGLDFQGQAVTRTTETGSDGKYNFDNLMPGQYMLIESQPDRLDDGKDSVGQVSDGQTEEIVGFLALDLFANDDKDADAIEGIQLEGGDQGDDYNFGELVHQSSKADFVRPLFYR
ncbi:MAG: SdrD B-like domain-containing protein [Pirellulales bacterium]